ncbi:probable basic-leucine zipper transcription factor R isoform X2 [Chrysemys picta bellii]|uniref:probable basic-leucine zipper transcription factor R isoform X2 n=1 Tax=Chrysemys picta bellii TaxID=8478 RepID=UPI0032B13C9E
MAMFVCPTGAMDRNVHVNAKTSYSENTAPLPAVNHLRSEECVLMAELPFLKSDIREIFEIPLKNDFKPRKRRRQFWRRSQLWRRKLWCHRPKVMEQQQRGREENQEVTQEQNPTNKGPKVIVQVQPQGQGGVVPQVTVQVQQWGQGWEAPQVTVQVQPQQLGPGWEAPGVTVQVQAQQQGQGGAAPQVTVQVQAQQQSQGGASLQVTVEVQPQTGHDREGSRVTQTQHQDQDEEGSKTMEQQLNLHERESQVMAKDEREPKELELEGNQGQDKEGAEAMEQQQDQSQDKERSKAMEQQLNLDESNSKVRVEDEREPKELEGKQGQDKKGTEVLEQQQDHRQDEEGSKAVELQKSSQEEEELKTMEMEQQQGQAQDKQTMYKKHLREMPNYFVSIPITNDQILDKIEDVQELIFTKEPDLLRALIPVQTMHLTIIVAHLRTEEEVKKAGVALEQSKAKVEAILQEAVEGSFSEMGLDITGSKDFKPHLTFLKLSKAPALRRKGFRKISSDLYKEYEDSPFGTEVFSQIDLCAMHKKKQESGYYHCEYSINVCSGSAEENKVKTEYLGEMATEVSPNGAAEVETEDITAGCNCASRVAKDYDKPSENIAEASVTNKETEIDEKDVQPEAKDETFTADGEVCSQSAPDLLPVNPDTLKGVDDRQEKAKLADGNLQRVEATEVASDQLNITA